MSSRNPPWSDLPQELLSAIANTLTSNPLDYLSFRSVCNPWRHSSLPLSHPSLLSPPLPLAIDPPPFCSPSRHSYFLSATTIYALRRPLQSTIGGLWLTPKSWILFLDEYTHGKVSLRKPFSKEFYSIPFNFPKTINLIDFNALELGRFYSLTCCDDSPEPGYCFEDVDKVVLFRNKLAAIVLLGEGKLWMIRFHGSGIRDWEIIHEGRGFRFDDIVEFKGRVLGIDRRGRVYEIVYHSLEIIPVSFAIVGGGGRRKRLVESFGSLYLVVRCNVNPTKSNRRTRGNVGRGKNNFKVYELDEGRYKWVEITSIGDRSFFFGLDFAFSAGELGRARKNCILFKKQSFRSYSGDNDDMQDLDIGVCFLNDASHVGTIGSCYGFSDMLWPPPRWVWTIDRLKRVELVEVAVDEMFERQCDIFKAKFKEKTLEEVEHSGDDFHEPHIREAVRSLLELKRSVTRFKEVKCIFVHMEKRLEELMTMHGLEEFIEILNQARASHVNDERLVYPDEIESALKWFDLVRLSETLLFQIEEQYIEMDKCVKALCLTSELIWCTQD